MSTLDNKIGARTPSIEYYNSNSIGNILRKPKVRSQYKLPCIQRTRIRPFCKDRVQVEDFLHIYSDIRHLPPACTSHDASAAYDLTRIVSRTLSLDPVIRNFMHASLKKMHDKLYAS